MSVAKLDLRKGAKAQREFCSRKDRKEREDAVHAAGELNFFCRRNDGKRLSRKRNIFASFAIFARTPFFLLCAFAPLRESYFLEMESHSG